ncbi:unnamed protein product [Prorocentrum cordatum]|uniref:Uncharacterized protein n=1 Tax=Prorocentrum cordatum TaxID=2364126 RepID=A0ABN9RJ16_9DINO|nr:unnamed protein product [Polarella glacialis]
MLAAALRSLVVAECEGGDGLPPQGEGPSVLFEIPLQGTAVGLAWGGAGDRIAVAVRGSATSSDRVCFVQETLGQEGTSIEEEIALPGSAGVTDVSMRYRPEDGGTWAAISGTDGALRLVDASPGAAPALVRTLYSHGVAATAVQLSGSADVIASGSASGNVVVQPFPGGSGGGPSSPAPLPSITAEEEEEEVTITSLCYSPLRPDALAACDAAGHIQVWDTVALRHLCVFSQAHGSSARGLSFSAHNSGLLISGGDDALLGFWDVNNGRRIREVSAGDCLSSISYHSGGYLLAVGTHVGSVLLFDLRMLVSASREQPALPVGSLSLQQADGPGPRGGPVRAMAFVPPPTGGGIASPPSSPGPSEAVGAGSPASAVDAAGAVAAGPAAPADPAQGAPGADADAGPAASRASAPPAAWAAPPVTPTLRHRGQEASEAMRFTIGTTPQDKPATASPWWSRAPEPADGADDELLATGAGSPLDTAPARAPPAGAAVAEALRPMMAELRQELLGEVREAQCALLEQGFRLHAELRQDVEALRAEARVANLRRLAAELERTGLREALTSLEAAVTCGSAGATPSSATLVVHVPCLSCLAECKAGAKLLADMEEKISLALALVEASTRGQGGIGFKLGSCAAAAAADLVTTALAYDLHGGGYPRDFANKRDAVNLEFGIHLGPPPSATIAPTPPTTWISDARGDSTDKSKVFLSPQPLRQAPDRKYDVIYFQYSFHVERAGTTDRYYEVYDVHHYFLDYDLIRLRSWRRERPLHFRPTGSLTREPFAVPSRS